MTLNEVREAAHALEALGVPVSANTVIARIGGSKRDVLKHLRTLRGTPAVPPVPTLDALHDHDEILGSELSHCDITTDGKPYETVLRDNNEVPPPVEEPTVELPAPGLRGYTRLPTVKVARPDTPEGYMIINAADYRAGLPQEMYDQGLAYTPEAWPLYQP